MAISSRENDPLQSGPLRLRESVRASLFALRYLTQVSLKDLSTPRQMPAAELDLNLVEQVEQALNCRLPFEVIACLANGDDQLREFGFVLGQVVDHTRLARKRGCSRDLIAVGCHPDFHAFYCVTREGSRDRAVQLGDLDNFDRSLNWYDLGDWLTQKLDGRQQFLAEQYLELVNWVPTPIEIADFKPALV